MDFDKPALLTDKVAVFDDVFDADYASQLFNWISSSTFQNVHVTTVSKVWRPHDGFPLTGQRAPMPGPRVLDRFCTLVGSAHEHELLKTVVDDHEFVNFAPWVYPPGSGLSLHADEPGGAGSYIYFAHPEWRPHWGGILCVLDRDTPSCGDILPWLDDREEARRALSPGHGLFIFPKPNRLVFMAADALHFVTKVEGANRISIAGFFVTEPLSESMFPNARQATWIESD
jgi:hypothetical protein